jgi:hypothetical protein
MKNLLFGLLATVIFSFTGNAQTKLTAKQNNVVSTQMVSLVNSVRSTYSSKISFPDWIKQTGPVNPSANEKLLFQKVYTYLSNNTSDCDIMKADNSILYTVIKEPISEYPNFKAKRCGLKCILKAIKDVIEIIIELLEE